MINNGKQHINDFIGQMARFGGDIVIVRKYFPIRQNHHITKEIFYVETWTKQHYYLEREDLLFIDSCDVQVVSDNVVVVAVKINGITYVGHAICHENDEFNLMFGVRLALARALKDEEAIEYYLSVSEAMDEIDVFDEIEKELLEEV